MPKTDNLIEFLSSTSFFAEVSKDALKKLCEVLEKENFRRNETIITQGDQGDFMYIILEGKVKIHDDDHVFTQLGASDCFGEYALIDNEVRSASVTTVERTKVMRLDRSDFLDLMVNEGGFAQGILSVLIKRHREIDMIQLQLSNSKQDLEIASSKMMGLIDGAMDAIIMFNSDFRIVLTNPSANKLLENDDVLQRNVLFFFDETGAATIESLVTQSMQSEAPINKYLPDVIKVIGSNETESLNEGTISAYGNSEQTFFTLILRNIEDRLKAEDKIEFLTTQTQYLEDEINELTSSYGILTDDASMHKVIALMKQVAQTDASVLITGETGTGKELVARGIHRASDRNDKPLIRINCGAIPANLIESELFGHKKGAFTGATSDRKGRFQLADKGTIFLDEIGEMPLELQPKLLRVIQEGEFDPVGSSETIKVDVRIIAATHRDLLAHSKEGNFREDLYYRLNVFPIEIPSLKDRGSDIVVIAQEMIQQISKKLNKPVGKLSQNDKNLLSSYHWPGNVRELQNLIERAVIVSQNGSIDWRNVLPSTNDVQQDARNSKDSIMTSKQLTALEKDNILKALKQTKWKISGKQGAAELLQLPPTTLTSRMKALGIERPT